MGRSSLNGSNDNTKLTQHSYDLGVIGGSVAAASFTASFNPNDDQTGAIVSLFTGGGFFGAALAGPAADKLGRRLAIVIGAVFFILGGVLQAVAQNLSFLYSGRAIAGFGVGFLVMIVPLYQAEISHPSIRGRVTGLQQLMLGIGAVVASEFEFDGRTIKALICLQPGLPMAPTPAFLARTTTNGEFRLVSRSSQLVSSVV